MYQVALRLSTRSQAQAIQINCPSLRSTPLLNDCYAKQITVSIVLCQPEGTQIHCGWQGSYAVMQVPDDILSLSL